MDFRINNEVRKYCQFEKTVTIMVEGERTATDKLTYTVSFIKVSLAFRRDKWHAALINRLRPVDISTGVG